MAARRKRATVQRGASIKASRFKAAGLRAHNARVGSAINSRSVGSPGRKHRSMGFAEAKMTRLRRKAGFTNPRLAARRHAGRSVLHYAEQAGKGGGRMVANPAKLGRRPTRMYKRDSRGRFAKKR